MTNEYDAHHALAASRQSGMYKVTFTSRQRFSSSTLIYANSIGDATEEARRYLGTCDTLTVERA
jgi:hypothetical protein